MVHPQPLEVVLDSPEVVLRTSASTDTEAEPAALSGNLVLRLTERTDIKDISLVFTGRAKLHYIDPAPNYKAHSVEIPLFHHDFAFFPEPVAHHTHTLNAGEHKFPFSLMLPDDLPGSLRTTGGSAQIDYKLKAHVVRSGFAHTNYTYKRPVQVTRGLAPDALEFTSSVDLENTWPGKVMYNFMIPFKAHPAGTAIPISMKFTPLAKGVRILSVTTSVVEHVNIQHKHGNNHTSETHTIAVHKELIEASRPPSTPGSAPLSRVQSRNDTNFSSGLQTPHRSAAPSPPAGVAPADLSQRLARVSLSNPRGSTNHSQHSSETPSPAPGTSSMAYIPEASGSGSVGSSQHTLLNASDEPHFQPLDPYDMPPAETHLLINIPIPAGVAPSTTVSPAIISHRIKWNAYIKNADGHVSELRCALPIILLSSSMIEEARLASSGARNLLFGPSGALLPDNTGGLDRMAELPAYAEHVHDRVPYADQSTTEYRPNPWASASTSNSPSTTPHPSRPSSPVGGHSSNSGSSNNYALVMNGHSAEPSASSSRRSSLEQQHRPRLSSDADHTQPSSSSNVPTSSSSRRFPHRGKSTASLASTASEPSPALSITSQSSTSSSLTGFFGHIHLPKKPLRSLTPLARNPDSSKSMHQPIPSNNLYSLNIPTTSTGPSQSSPVTSNSPDNTSSRPSSPRSAFYSQVPTYENTMLHPHGGGVVPLSSLMGLPQYVEGERPPTSRSTSEGSA